MPSSRFPILHGTLDMLILQILSGARLRHCPTARAGFEGCCANQPGLALSCSPPPGTEGLADGGVEAIGNRTRSEVLLSDTFRTKAAQSREGKLGSAYRSGPVGF